MIDRVISSQLLAPYCVCHASCKSGSIPLLVLTELSLFGLLPLDSCLVLFPLCAILYQRTAGSTLPSFILTPSVAFSQLDGRVYDLAQLAVCSKARPPGLLRREGLTHESRWKFDLHCPGSPPFYLCLSYVEHFM